MTAKDTRVVAFLSGKGGSGKTTVAISMAKLLSDMGFRCQLVDFDLATNGATYFFKNQLGLGSTGILEVVLQGTRQQDPGQKPEKSADNKVNLGSLASVIDIDERLSFVPSKANLGARDAAYEDLLVGPTFLRDIVLLPLLEKARRREYDYMFIDCQAGCSASSIAAAGLADLAIIVAEADSISSDAAENLVMQLGHRMPRERRYLVNKIDIRDADTYRSMHDVFQSLNRLPPLPFDFSVRNAFGARQIPVDINEPSPLLFALFETIKYAFSEIYQAVDQYRKSHIDRLFAEFETRVQSLIDERAALQTEQNTLTEELSLERRQLTRLWSTFTSVTLLAVGSIGSLVASGIARQWIAKLLSSEFSYKIVPIILIYLSFFGFAGVRLYTRRRTRLEDIERSRNRLHKDIANVEKELDQVRSLLWTRSREYLLDSVVAGTEGRHITNRQPADDEGT